MLNKSLLHWVQVSALRKTLDSGYLRALAHGSKGKAGVDAAAINQYRTGTALPVVAALFCTRHSQVFTERI